jgi:cytoskeletal protein RodZ
MDKSPMNKELPEKKARQGRLGLPVLIVLVAGLILAAVAWWGAEIFGMLIETDQTMDAETVAPDN